MTQVRPPAVAGMFYTANPKALAREIDEMLNNASVEPIKGQVMALIAPHAGYVYSGLTAAHAYKLLEQRSYETVIVLSPSHREYFRGVSVYNGDAYRTPLGDILIDTTLRDELIRGDKLIVSSDDGHGSEHAVEVQLPFLQKVLSNFKLLPVVVGDQQRDVCFHLSNKLAKVLPGKNVLLVASSDLSHYHPAEEANRLDKIVRDDIAAFDYEKLMKDIETEKAEACGGGPAVVALATAKQLGANRVKVLHHCNSGDVSGEHESVVGYLSAVAYKE
jgi:MEMO1 family protein